MHPINVEFFKQTPRNRSGRVIAGLSDQEALGMITINTIETYAEGNPVEGACVKFSHTALLAGGNFGIGGGSPSQAD